MLLYFKEIEIKAKTALIAAKHYLHYFVQRNKP